MNRPTTIVAHLRRMPTHPGTEDRYKIVIVWVEGICDFVNDNNGMGYQLYRAEEIFATLQKTIVGTYENHPKVAR